MPGSETFQSTPRKFIVLQETKPPKKIFIYFLKRKLFLFSGNGNPETETLKSFLYFRRTCKAQKTNKKVFFEEIPYFLQRFCNFYISRAYGNSLRNKKYNTDITL